jgi:hypothetical protein
MSIKTSQKKEKKAVQTAFFVLLFPARAALSENRYIIPLAHIK